MMQQYQQKQLEAQQQGFQMLNNQVASMQIGIQDELGQYKKEIGSLKDKHQELFTNTNNLCNRILKQEDMMNKEMIDLKKWQDRPAFQGCLKSDFEAGSSSQVAPPTTPTTAPSSAPTDYIPPAQAPAPQHNQEDYYPEQFFQE
ncbi:hypothetical protein PIB30_105975 [Stylosanthes scabra]|uniref:Uncharacterized protein n=1 Tax=Stylosanthes scabra TaxID=79078 RepID=A0ABU6UYL2_9FABA|nr:hypothetical protein [Stylosanthes scabra]